MISGIYPYIAGISATGLKNSENLFRNAVNGKAGDLKGGAVAERGILGNVLATDEGINLSASGSVAQGSTGLFAEVSDLSSGQEIPQMIVAQRGYEAYVKTIRAKDETLEYTLDTFA
jgi:flagellar hook protein FlgE